MRRMDFYSHQKHNLLRSPDISIKSGVWKVEAVVDAAKNTDELHLLLLKNITQEWGFKWLVCYSLARREGLDVFSFEASDGGKLLIS